MVAALDIAALPGDPEALRALLVQVCAERDGAVAERDALEAASDRLRHLLRRLLRVRVGDGPITRPSRHLPGEEVWPVGEWRGSGERKYYLSNLPPGTPLRTLAAAAAIKARWVCEQAHQQLKQELGLGHFEGRSWTGLHRHALMTCVAFAWLQHLRLKAARGRGEKAGVSDGRRAAAAAESARGAARRHRAAFRPRRRSGALSALQVQVQTA